MIRIVQDYISAGIKKLTHTERAPKIPYNTYINDKDFDQWQEVHQVNKKINVDMRFAYVLSLLIDQKAAIL